VQNYHVKISKLHTVLYDQYPHQNAFLECIKKCSSRIFPDPAQERSLGGGSQLPKCLQEHMTEAKLKFPDGWGSNQNPSTWGCGYFLKSHNLVWNLVTL